MKLYYKDQSEELNELKQVQCIGEGDIIVRVGIMLSEEKIREMEHELRKKLRRRVAVLDARYGEILLLPPKNESKSIS